jgi:hypothetical protein
MFDDFEDIEDFDFEDDGVPRIRVDSATSVTDLELTLRSNHDDFYRRIVDHILNRLEGDRYVTPVAILVDEEGTEYEMQVEEDGYNKALDKANEYFVSIEEYETCDLIKQMYEIIEKKNGLR